jgi:UDP-N-acetylglucosamine--N-acetylmuramyl-(pentapeptide) pyrophosphoryl-undecaprenol N-acetylglucosamine transferase
MKIVLTGGGSGGHITPLLAVAHELRKLKPQAHIIYIGQRGDNLVDIPTHDPNIDEVFTVRAGKFRRYNGEGLKQLLDTPTILKNGRDLGRVIRGFSESRRLLKKIKPDIIFVKGGFVGVPVGLAAAQLHIPFVTHDSDTIPGLANRIISRWAIAHTVALPKEVYSYPANKTFTVGVPVSAEYQRVSPEKKAQYRHELKLEKFNQMVFVTGGGNGAKQLNEVIVANATYILQRYPNLVLVHVAGRALEQEVRLTYDRILPETLRPRVVVKGFVTDLYLYSGAADVIVARGGATNLAEFAIQAKACIVIPSKQLVWNIKNTEVLSERNAVIKLTEVQAEQERRLALTISSLLDDDKERKELGLRLSSFARPNAAHELAELIIKIISKIRSQ